MKIEFHLVRKSHNHGFILWENAAMNHFNQSSMTDGVRCERLVVAEEIRGWGRVRAAGRKVHLVSVIQHNTGDSGKITDG
jgi:hypothetical protein